MSLFQDWLKIFRMFDFDAFLNLKASKADRFLADYGYFCFQVERSRLSFCETINGVVDIQASWRRLLPQAWDVAWVWKGMIESYSHTPMPDVVFLAYVSLSLVWGWHIAPCSSGGSQAHFYGYICL